MDNQANKWADSWAVSLIIIKIPSPDTAKLRQLLFLFFFFNLTQLIKIIFLRELQDGALLNLMADSDSPVSFSWLQLDSHKINNQ